MFNFNTRINNKIKDFSSFIRKITIVTSLAASTLSALSLGTPASSLIKMTECTNLKLTNVIVGYDGKYTYKKGFKKDTSYGLLKRKKAKVTNKCILPSLNPSQITYFEVDEKKFKAFGSSNNFSMQCIRSNKPSAGALSETQSKNEFAKIDYLSAKAMMLKCGNSEGIKQCDKGNNSQRSRAWKKKLKKDGKIMMSILAVKSQLAPKGGEKLFCQYYNEDSGKSLFAFEYIRTRL